MYSVRFSTGKRKDFTKQQHADLRKKRRDYLIIRSHSTVDSIDWEQHDVLRSHRLGHPKSPRGNRIQGAMIQLRLNKLQWLCCPSDRTRGKIAGRANQLEHSTEWTKVVNILTELPIDWKSHQSTWQNLNHTRNWESMVDQYKFTKLYSRNIRTYSHLQKKLATACAWASRSIASGR